MTSSSHFFRILPPLLPPYPHPFPPFPPSTPYPTSIPQMSPGALVSFMLYQQSLSGAFSMMGDVFSALTAAVGAADKVRRFCLWCSMHLRLGQLATCIVMRVALVLLREEQTQMRELRPNTTPHNAPRAYPFGTPLLQPVANAPTAHRPPCTLAQQQA